MIADDFYRSKKSIFIKLPTLLFQVIKTGKLAEFSSFCWWEILAKIGFYKNKYLTIKQHPACVDISLNKQNLDFKETSLFFKSEIQYQSFFKDSNNNIYYSVVNEPNVLYVKRSDTGEIVKAFEFQAPIICIYVNKALTIFVCYEQHIYRSDFHNDYKFSFQETLTFIAETGYLRTNFSYTENDKGELFFAEYAAVYHEKEKSRHRRYTKAYLYIDNFKHKKGWECVAYLYHSVDDGKTWEKYDFLKRNGTNKHIHIIQWSNLLKGLILTDGDNTKHLYFNKSHNYNQLTRNVNKGWKDLTVFHVKKGGYTSLVETKDGIIFGTDYMGGTNFFRKTKDLIKYKEQVIPNPYRKCIIDSMTIVTCQGKELVFANLLCSFSNKYNSMILLSDNSGETWSKVLEYDGFSAFVDIINNNYSETDELYFLISNNKDANVTYSLALNQY